MQSGAGLFCTELRDQEHQGQQEPPIPLGMGQGWNRALLLASSAVMVPSDRAPLSHGFCMMAGMRGFGSVERKTGTFLPHLATHRKGTRVAQLRGASCCMAQGREQYSTGLSGLDNECVLHMVLSSSGALTICSGLSQRSGWGWV